MRSNALMISLGAALGALAVISIFALVRAETAIMRADLMSQSAAQSAALTPEAEARIVADATEAALAALSSEDTLGAEIEKGIEAYVAAQRQVQQQSRTDRQAQADDKAKNVRPVSGDRDHILGSPDAVVSLIEYSDFECPYCKRFHTVAKEVVESYPDQVNWVYRHLPLDMHNPGAQKQAEATECAAEQGGGEAFWKYTDAIFERTRSGGRGFPLEDLGPLAAEIGLDQTAFQDCVDSERMAERVKEDMAEAQSMGIRGTPNSILRNAETGEVRVVRGAASKEALKAAIDSLI